MFTWILRIERAVVNILHSPTSHLFAAIFRRMSHRHVRFRCAFYQNNKQPCWGTWNALMAAVTQFTDELNLVDSRFLEPVSSIIDVAVSICWLHLVVIISFVQSYKCRRLFCETRWLINYIRIQSEEKAVFLFVKKSYVNYTLRFLVGASRRLLSGIIRYNQTFILLV